MNEIKLINLRQNSKKNTWVANFESSNGIQINDVKISSKSAMDFIINSNNDMTPILDQQDKNIIVYNFS